VIFYRAIAKNGVLTDVTSTTVRLCSCTCPTNCSILTPGRVSAEEMSELD
jgi:hypothetical protein